MLSKINIENKGHRTPYPLTDGEFRKFQLSEFINSVFASLPGIGRRIKANPGRVLGIAAGIGTVVGPTIIDSLLAHVEAAPQNDARTKIEAGLIIPEFPSYYDQFLSKISVPEITAAVNIQGVDFNIDSGVSQRDQELIVPAVLSEKAVIQGIFGTIPTGVTVDVKSTPPPNVTAVSSNMNREIIDTINSVWMQSDDLNRMRISGMGYYEIFQRQKSGSQGEVKGPAWLTYGEQRLMTDITLILTQKINPQDWLRGYIISIAQAQNLPSLSNLEQSSSWVNAPEAYQAQAAVAALLLIAGNNGLDFMKYLTFHTTTSNNLPWQGAFASAFGKDPDSFYNDYNQIISPYRPVTSATRTSTATATSTARLTPTPTNTAELSTSTPTASPRPSATPTLHPYYTQSLSANFSEGSILIMASSGVDSRALPIARDNIMDAYSYRSDIRGRLIFDRNFSVAIMRDGVSILNEPDFKDIPIALAGSRMEMVERNGRVALAVGEENLLQLPSNNYPPGYSLLHHGNGHVTEIYGIPLSERLNWLDIHSRLSTQPGFPDKWRDILYYPGDGLTAEAELFAEIYRVWLAGMSTQVRSHDDLTYQAFLSILGPK